MFQWNCQCKTFLRPLFFRSLPLLPQCVSGVIKWSNLTADSWRVKLDPESRGFNRSTLTNEPNLVCEGTLCPEATAGVSHAEAARLNLQLQPVGGLLLRESKRCIDHRVGKHEAIHNVCGCCRSARGQAAAFSLHPPLWEGSSQRGFDGALKVLSRQTDR